MSTKRRKQRTPSTPRARESTRPAPSGSLCNLREVFGPGQQASSLSNAQRRRFAGGAIQPGDVAALRRLAELTQPAFARALGISVATLRNWEQGRTRPNESGLALLRIAARYPRILREDISTARRKVTM